MVTLLYPTWEERTEIIQSPVGVVAVPLLQQHGVPRAETDGGRVTVDDYDAWRVTIQTRYVL